MTCIGKSIKPLVSNDQVPGSYCNTVSPYLGFWAGKPEYVRAETEGWMELTTKHTQYETSRTFGILVLTYHDDLYCINQGIFVSILLLGVRVQVLCPQAWLHL